MAVLAPGPSSGGVGAAIELEWTAPAECPSADEVRANVAQLLGGASASEPVRAQVTVSREPAGFAAELVLVIGEQRSERRLVAAQCSALADAAAVVIAVTVDPVHAVGAEMREEAAPLPEPPSEPSLATADASPASAVAEPEPIAVPVVGVAPMPPPRRVVRRPGVYLRVFGGVDYGDAPKATGALGGAIGLFGHGWRAELDASGAFPRTTELTRAPGVRARLGRWSLAARGCGVPGRGRIEVPLCGAIEAGAISGEGRGETVDPQRRVLRPWIAAVLGPALAVRVVPRLAVLIGADVVVPLWRARFVIGDDTVHRPTRVGVRGLAGVELRLGGGP